LPPHPPPHHPRHVGAARGDVGRHRGSCSSDYRNQNVGCDPFAGIEEVAVLPFPSDQHVTQDQEGPSVAEGIEREADRASAVGPLFHPLSIQSRNERPRSEPEARPPPERGLSRRAAQLDYVLAKSKFLRYTRQADNLQKASQLSGEGGLTV
jgi:hypothetical protein